MSINIKKMFSYIVILGLIAMLFGNSTIMAKDKTDIVTMTELIEKEENLTIESWSVYARERTLSIKNQHSFESEVKKLQAEFPLFIWKHENNASGWKAIGTYTNAETKNKESINLMSTRENNQMVTYIIYEVKGSHWDHEAKSFFTSSFEKRTDDIFREKPLIFSCIQGTISDTMDTVLTSEMTKLLGVFKGKIIESMKEPNFISVSGQTSLFDQYLEKKHHLNLQLALRTEGLSGKTTFVVGTPIVTFEY